MTLHTKLSYVKSALRLVGYGLIIHTTYAQDDQTFIVRLWSAGAILIVSELIGIAEEAWPGAYKGTETKSPS